MSFREKSLWLLFFGLVVVFGRYFMRILPADTTNVEAGQIDAFVVSIVFLIVLQIVGHVVIAAINRQHEEDERDRLIELKGTRNGSLVLGFGVFLSLWAAVGTDGNFVFTHLLLAFWVMAELVEIATQLFLYRRGA